MDKRRCADDQQKWTQLGKVGFLINNNSRGKKQRIFDFSGRRHGFPNGWWSTTIYNGKTNRAQEGNGKPHEFGYWWKPTHYTTPTERARPCDGKSPFGWVGAYYFGSGRDKLNGKNTKKLFTKERWYSRLNFVQFFIPNSNNTFISLSIQIYWKLKM
jgi:hypothetical protein